MQTKLITLRFSMHVHDFRVTYEHLNFLSYRPMSCVYLHACIMIPHGEELTEEFKNLTVRLHKDGKVYRKISDQLKTVTAAGIRRYRMSQSTTNQSDNGHPPKITQQKGRYLHNLV